MDSQKVYLLIITMKYKHSQPLFASVPFPLAYQGNTHSDGLRQSLKIMYK